MKINTKPVKITGDPYALVVNAAFKGDRNVVISFWPRFDPNHRDAIGFSPKKAREMAAALLVAADAVEGELVEPSLQKSDCE